MDDCINLRESKFKFCKTVEISVLRVRCFCDSNLTSRQGNLKCAPMFIIDVFPLLKVWNIKMQKSHDWKQGRERYCKDGRRK